MNYKYLIVFSVFIFATITTLVTYFFIPWPSFLNSSGDEKKMVNIASLGGTQLQNNSSVKDYTPQNLNEITWGVDFSEYYAKRLKLDWKETYLAIINDLSVKNIKIHTNWDFIEAKKNNYTFSNTDWQLAQAKKSGAKVIYVLGMKTGRYPECHIPEWASNLSEKEQQSYLLDYLKTTVLRYKDSEVITYWQVENEPLFQYGKCPSWYYNSDEFLKKEVSLVKSLDPSRQIIISDSGERSDWSGAALIGDIVGTTMYRSYWPSDTEVYNSEAYTFLPPSLYFTKAGVIKEKFKKDVICIELQAEPWTRVPFIQSTLEERLQTMNPEMFKTTIDFAQQTGLDTFYLWGAEWWYEMKTERNQPELWNEAKGLFKNGIIDLH